MDNYIDSLNRLINSVNEIVIIVDTEGIIVTASDMAIQVFRMEFSEGRPLQLAKFFPQVIMDAIFSRVRDASTKMQSMIIKANGPAHTTIDLDARSNLIELDGRQLVLISCRDIREYTNKISRLTAREDLYRTIFHESPLGFIHINSDGYVADCNQEFLNIFGYFKEQIIGICVADESHDQIPGMDSRFIDSALSAIKGEHIAYEDRFDVDSGFGARKGWMRVSFSPIVSENNSFLGAVGIVEDITDEKDAEEKIEFIGNHDALTGLLNRHACENDMKEIDRPEFTPIGIIYIDLDHLKLANDAFGHQEGDELLKKCAAILNANATPMDSVYRLGGDEFVILMKNTNRTDIRSRVSSIAHMCSAWPANDGFVRPSMATGFAVKSFEGLNIEETLKEAEDMMYANKLRNGPSVRRRLMSTLEGKLAQLMDGAVGKRAARMSLWGEWAARVLGISDDAELNSLRLLFRYHDIGILAHSDELKRVSSIPMDGDLTEAFQHPIAGYRIARTVAEISPACDLILSHHERWDGKGSPSGLSGDSIPYLSRVVSIFDVLEGILCFRGALSIHSFDEAVSAVVSAAGKAFDPALTKRLASAMRTERPEFAVGSGGA